MLEVDIGLVEYDKGNRCLQKKLDGFWMFVLCGILNLNYLYRLYNDLFVYL